MQIFKTIKETQDYSLQKKRENKKVGLVPTMGYLHEGHLSLIDIARKEADCVIVSIFVNPSQFGPDEDLDKYPRDFERDRQLCEERGVDAIFAPLPDEMYFSDSSVWVTEESLSKGLCGKSRPVHFRGVTTVVSKLFNAALPDIAVFGQKDAQQAAILKRMVRDLNFPIKVITGPIVREEDGLAMSSRNKYLSQEERKNALSISKALFEAQSNKDTKDSVSIIQKASETISSSGGKIDYIELVDFENLEPVSIIKKPALLAAAVFFGKTRLIDNVLIEP
jgi:pantoate--beta-alanine ligase